MSAVLVGCLDRSGSVAVADESKQVSAIEKLGGTATVDAEGSITMVKLSRAQVADNDLRQLKGLSNLRALWLTGTPITDKGLKYLNGLENLRELSLVSTDVTDKGIEKLQKALPNCKIHH